MNHNKYARGYFMPPVESLEWTKKEYISQAPTWCSVDLRDGNQALIIPMSLEEKLAYFELLVEVGFKEIEVGFPAASETEYAFLRKLIEEDLIPDDVTVQVLTQARDHIIKRTFEALSGVNKAVVHVYNSTSLAQREQVFRRSKEQITEIAITGANLLKKYAAETPGNFQFQYSPESFTGTEIEYALEVCNKVIDIWKPTADNKVIINLPATVQMSMPHVYASQIEYMSNHLHDRKNVIVSVHPHNDRGTGVADTELAVLAGADRIEGTLFGNGERTGNVDIVTLALNMFSHGIDPNLNFANIQEIAKQYEKLTRMTVHERHPYAGELVFTAFSGSHQDAIAKGMKWRDDEAPSHWSVPYLPIDPMDIGRQYEGDIIRINSQSGKGGVAYILQQSYAIDLPLEMRESFGYRVKDVSDQSHKELSPKEIYDLFMDEYVNVAEPIEYVDFKYTQNGEYNATLSIRIDGEIIECKGKGNGRFNAVSNALRNELGIDIIDLVYKEHSLEIGSSSQAISYVGFHAKDGGFYWGSGIDTDIIVSSIKGLFSAINQLKKNE